MLENTTEVWRPVKGYEGFYEVSNLGRIKSLGNKSNHKDEKILALNKKKDGYVNATIQINKKPKTFRVHRLGAEAFIPKPEGLNVVNHKDYNRSNNCVENLEWTNTRENYLYSMCHQPKTRKLRSDNASGERYVNYNKRHKTYYVNFKGKWYGSYKTIEDAIAKRDAIVKDFEKAETSKE